MEVHRLGGGTAPVKAKKQELGCMEAGGRQNLLENKYWTELRGTKLFLYDDKKQEMFADKIDLKGLVTVADKYPSNKQRAEVVLTLENEEVHIRTELTEDAEEWKGFIRTVVELAVPNCLALLPGQLIRLKEVLEKETSRRASDIPEEEPPSPPLSTCKTYEEVFPTNTPCKTYEDAVSFPQCFHSVTRAEAAEMLLKTESSENLILRPGADSISYAVSIREDLDKPLIKHYRVVSSEKGYKIELDKPITLDSLQEVVDHFVKETKGKLKPFNSHEYDTQIDDHKKRISNTFSQKKKLQYPSGTDNTYVNVTSWK
uniref:Signal transducing adaptor family member 1 n=1 Tax=Leptobrachium leishanense TaxID=445787 RepID=A0A8C5P6G9_9ANUR